MAFGSTGWKGFLNILEYPYLWLTSAIHIPTKELDEGKEFIFKTRGAGEMVQGEVLASHIANPSSVHATAYVPLNTVRSAL